MTLPLVIGTSGAKRSGKSTLARFFIERHGYRQKSFAEPLKRAALTLDPLVAVPLHHDEPALIGYYDRLSHVISEFGWEVAKDRVPEVRRILQRLGTEVGRGLFGENAWVNLAGPWPQDRPTVFADVRFDNEASAVLLSRGAVLVVERPGYELDGSHASEAGVNPALVHARLVNDGTPEDLYRKALAAF